MISPLLLDMKQYLLDLLLNPINAFIVFTVFIFILLFVLDEQDVIEKKFLNFGPSKDTKFLHITLDTWPKVIAVYTLAFLSAAITTYYKHISDRYIKKSPEIKVSHFTAINILTFEEILYKIFSIISIFIKFTLELQFIIPELIGSLFINIPFNIKEVYSKKIIFNT